MASASSNSQLANAEPEVERHSLEKSQENPPILLLVLDKRLSPLGYYGFSLLNVNVKPRSFGPLLTTASSVSSGLSV